MTPDYAAIARRVSDMTTTPEDTSDILDLLRNDPTAKTDTLGDALPCFASADSFENFVLDSYPSDVACIEDAGQTDNVRYAGFYHRDHGNEYGESERLGAAMWAAFVRLLGNVDDDEQG